MQPDPTPAPLDEAIWSLAEILTSHGIDPAMFEDDARKLLREAVRAFEGSESNRDDVRIAAAVRAAAPIIAAPIEAERDLNQRGWDEAIAAFDAAVDAYERQREGGE